jgi:hypothetical protein
MIIKTQADVTEAVLSEVERAQDERFRTILSVTSPPATGTRVSASPGRNLDLVAIRVVNIKRVDRHEGVLSATELEAEAFQARTFELIVLRGYFQSNVVQPASARQRLVRRHCARDQHHLLWNALALRTNAQEFHGHLRWGDGLQPECIPIKGK